MPQNNHMELYHKRYGKRFDHEERTRKKEARSVKETAEKARKLHAPTMVAKSTPRRSMFDDDDDDDDEPSEEAPAQATIMVRRKKPAV